MGLPPVVAGGVHLTLAEPLPATAVTFVGDDGGCASGTATLDAVDVGPVPTAFVALTLKV